MGGFFSALLGGDYPEDIFIDFENPQPSSEEQKLYGEMQQLIEDGEALIQEISDYKGCGALQRQAMQQKTQEAELECFEALLISVNKVHSFYTFARRLEEGFPRLLSSVCTVNQEGKETIADKQALAYQVGAIFNFVLRFDQLRMMTPDLSNDFSYYRRLLSKHSNHPDIVVDSDMCSGMGMFTAEHIPMLSSIQKAGLSVVQRNEQVELALALMANSCRSMIVSRSFSNPDTNLFCARAMTGAIVLYDLITTFGVFHKKSPVQVKNCIVLLKTEFADEHGLLNAIHYSTKTFRQAPSNIQSLFS